MKALIFFEDGHRSAVSLNREAAWLRKKYQPEALLGISAGDFRANGLPYAESAVSRADSLCQGGADLVLSLPAASMLGGFGKKDFATVALAQRLHAAQTIALPCRPSDGQSLEQCVEILRSCAMVIFREIPVYRSAFRNNLKQSLPFHLAQLQAAAACVPEGETLLRFRENRQTIRLLDAMLQLYYMPAIEFFDIRDTGAACAESESGSSGDWPEMRRIFEANAARTLKHFLTEQAGASLADIAGCTEEMIRALQSHDAEIRHAVSLQTVVDILVPHSPSEEAARLFLLRILLQITHSNMQINGLHLYTPYCHLLAGNPQKTDLLEAVRQSSWVPVVGKELPNESAEAQYPLLLAIDRKACCLFE